MNKEREKVSIKAILPDDKYKWLCRDCGGEDVEETTWSSINDYIIINRQTYARVSVESANDSFYCNDCNSECSIKPLEEDSRKCHLCDEPTINKYCENKDCEVYKRDEE